MDTHFSNTKYCIMLFSQYALFSDEKILITNAPQYSAQVSLHGAEAARRHFRQKNSAAELMSENEPLVP
jgi:hypothetical protein